MLPGICHSGEAIDLFQISNVTAGEEKGVRTTNYNDNQWNNHHKKPNKNSSKNKNQKRLTKRSNWYLINLTFKELKRFLDSRIDKKSTNDPSLKYDVDGFESTPIWRLLML